MNRDGNTPTPWLRWLPGVRMVQSYQRAWLWPDVAAGAVLTALLVPQGMAYAELAGLPAVTGLYTTVVALVAYAVLGPSRILVLGPDSSLAPLIAAAVLVPVAANEADQVALAGVLALLVGLICVVVGAAQLGTVTELLSKPVRVGYINGIAVVVLVSQLPKLFGFSVAADGVVPQVVAFAEGLFAGSVVPSALAIGVVSLAVILVARRISHRIPGVLITVVAAIVAVSVLDLADDGLSVVGSLPAGFPTPALPTIAWGDLGPLAVAALGVAFVAFTDTAALSTTFAAKLDQNVDPNHEIIALGAANAAAGLFRGFPVSASSSRTSVAEAVGSRTQLTGIVAATGVALLLLFAADLLADLPSATLAAIVIVASLTLFDLDEMRWLWRVRRSEFILSAAAFLGVALVGVLEGIVIAIALSLSNFVRRAWRPHDAVLGRVEGLRGYHDLGRYPEGLQIPGLVIYRFDSPLFFANAEHFERRLAHLLRSAPHPVRRVVLAAEPMTDIDTTAAETLAQILDLFDQRGLRLHFAELKDPVKDRLRRYGLYERLGDDRFHPTLGTAVSAYVEDSGIDWVDWTDA